MADGNAWAGHDEVRLAGQVGGPLGAGGDHDGGARPGVAGAAAGSAAGAGAMTAGAAAGSAVGAGVARSGAAAGDAGGGPETGVVFYDGASQPRRSSQSAATRPLTP